MDVMTLSDKKSNTFIDQLVADYPQFKFASGKRPHWSPRSNTVIYSTDKELPNAEASVLHELAHALLEHNDYQSDFELLKLETEAWDLAAKLAPKYKVGIEDDYIQKCLDTYRDWLHNRSTCPSCGLHSLQQNAGSYRCFNCQTEWSVTSRRFSRSYRKALKK